MPAGAQRRVNPPAMHHQSARRHSPSAPCRARCRHRWWPVRSARMRQAFGTQQPAVHQCHIHRIQAVGPVPELRRCLVAEQLEHLRGLLDLIVRDRDRERWWLWEALRHGGAGGDRPGQAAEAPRPVVAPGGHLSKSLAMTDFVSVCRLGCGDRHARTLAMTDFVSVCRLCR
jgi:hypothetical protein